MGRTARAVAAAIVLAGCGSGHDITPTGTGTQAAVLTTVVVALSPSTVQVGQSASAGVTGLDQNGAPISVGTVVWSTASALVATVNTSGIVTGVAAGQTQIIASVGSKHGQQLITVVPSVPVATIEVAPAPAAVNVGGTLQLTATAKDASGNVLTGRSILWASRTPNVATVSATGLVTARVVAGTDTITATSEGKSAVTAVTVVLPANMIITGIHNILSFMSQCPTSDPAYATIRQDFQFLSEGQPDSAVISCIEPYITAPMTDELNALQALRASYYMNQGSAGKLPWTSLPFYDWMKAQVAGVNFRVQPGLSYCCDFVNGKRYIGRSREDPASLNAFKDWKFLSIFVTLLAHEARHVAGPGHVTGCPAFPLSTDALGCDAVYDPAHMSSYGVQYWLQAGWATGMLVVGTGCAPADTAQSFANFAATDANSFIPLFVKNPPPSVTATLPYGGPCFP